MNEIFNFKRFGTYFLYDLKQMWRKHSKAAIMIGCSIAFLYVLWVLFSLLFTQHWASPGIEFRVAMLLFAFMVLEFYQTRTYGELTEKKAGSAWLMIPASKTEKFVSMILMTLVVIPLLFFAVFFCIDGLLSLVDPTYGKALIGGFLETYQKMLEGIMSVNNESPVVLSSVALFFIGLASFVNSFLYFLLCGVCFKKNKIILGLAILFGASTLLSIITGLTVPFMVNHLTPIDINEEQVARLTAGILNGSEVVAWLFAIGFGWGIWRRIKTIQH